LTHFIEEQLKRQNSEYNQIAFNYDEMGPKESSAMPEEQEEIDTTPFISKIELPSDIEPPKTLKSHQIIEKTAKFIASQGPQMEILLKTKQSNNPQFNFLSHDGQYNSYYKHILSLMKAGTYQYDENIEKIDETSQESDETNGKSDEPEPTTSAIIIPKIAFKPSADCAYTQLISKITKAPISVIEQKQKQQESNATNGHSTIKSSGLLGLASYCSDSENSDEESEGESYSGPTPPQELQVVIDKTALYVAKNGDEFEETLKKKNDSRFPFLKPTDEFHTYYRFKVKENRKTFPSTKTNTTNTVLTPTTNEIKKPLENVETSIKTKIPPAPVSFSIKSKDEKSQLISKPLDETIEISNRSQSPKDISVEEELEMQVDALNAEKLAKEKLTEKLFTAARKNLGMSKEKILQMERKKKALMFVNQIKGISCHHMKLPFALNFSREISYDTLALVTFYLIHLSFFLLIFPSITFRL
jgi:hypothetical protein